MDAENNTWDILRPPTEVNLGGSNVVRQSPAKSPIDMLCGDPDTIYRFNVYRRMFTPYEEEHKYLDDTEYVDLHYTFATINDVAPLGNGDYLIEMRICDEDGEDMERSEYYRLDEIRLSKFDCDNIKENRDKEDDRYES